MEVVFEEAFLLHVDILRLFRHDPPRSGRILFLIVVSELVRVKLQ